MKIGGRIFASFDWSEGRETGNGWDTDQMAHEMKQGVCSAYTRATSRNVNY